MNTRLAVLIIPAALALAGCAPQHRSWQFDGVVLTPPGPAQKEIKLANVRAGGRVCRLEQPGIRVELRGRNARVRANAVALGPQGGVAMEGSAKLTADVLVREHWFRNALRPWLVEQESNGCLSGAESNALAERIIDHLAIPSSMAYRLRYGEYILDGYLDLDPRFRLKLVEPLRENSEVVGFTSHYYMLDAAPGGGVTVRAGEAEINRLSVITHATARDHALLHLPAGATHVRFFFRTWSVRQDRRIALIAASTSPALAEATRAFEANPEEWCAHAACVEVPKDAVIGPELAVTVNGATRYLPVGSSLAELYYTAKLKPETLRVERPFEGRLAPVEFSGPKNNMLNFVPAGGERITW